MSTRCRATLGTASTLKLPCSSSSSGAGSQIRPIASPRRMAGVSFCDASRLERCCPRRTRSIGNTPSPARSAPPASRSRGPTCCARTIPSSAPRSCAPAHHRLPRGGARELRQAGQLYRAPDRALDQAIPHLRDRAHSGDGRSHGVAAEQCAAAERYDHRARRLPSRQRDLSPNRAQDSRGARLGALDVGRAACRLRLSLHELVHPVRAIPRHRGPGSGRARHSRRRRISGNVLQPDRALRHRPRALGFLSRLQPVSHCRHPARHRQTRRRRHGRVRPRARRGQARPADGRARLEAGGENPAEGRLNFDYSPKVQELRARLLAFMAEHIYPNEESWQAHVTGDRRWQPVPVIEELKPKARAAGLWHLWRPKTHGGSLSNLEYAPLCEIMGRVYWAPEVLNCSAPDTGNMETLLKFGTADQNRAWCEPLLEGRIRSAFLMTEPNVASSDATNIRTRIARDRDHYVINGVKWWSSGAGDSRCRIYIVMGKTDPDNVSRHRQVAQQLDACRHARHQAAAPPAGVRL